MGETIWNNALEYLKKSRSAWWNEDYMRFLVERVWKITEPVSIIDFGCGIGFLGKSLLPMLPVGSTYTGIDIGDKLLEEAKRDFQNTNYQVEFICSDLIEFVAKEKYDIAICQTVLQHIPDPLSILEKMKSAVKDGGLVIGIEISRNAASGAFYVDGFEYDKLNLLGIEQKIRCNSFDTLKKDFEIGVKLPIYMQKIGLNKVQARMNDFVQFVNPYDDDYCEQLEALMYAQYDDKMTEEMRQQFIEAMINRGLSREEAIKMFEGQKAIRDYLQENKKSISAVNSHCMFISSGIV